MMPAANLQKNECVSHLHFGMTERAGCRTGTDPETGTLSGAIVVAVDLVSDVEGGRCCIFS